MTATRGREAASRLWPAAVPDIMRLLESGWYTTGTATGAVANQYLLDALDRGDHPRFYVWPPSDPAAVVYVGSSGTAVPAGDPGGGPWLAEPAERSGWRVLVGEAALCDSLLAATPRGLWRRRPRAREQRFMVRCDAGGPDPGSGGSGEADAAAPPSVDGLRRATMADLDVLTDFACRLHVEDRMGPPIPRANRGSVRARVRRSLVQEATWVVERDGEVAAKLDLSLHSRRRGAQVAGVYVASAWRGRGLAAGAVGELARSLLREGLPAVTLHVRADNAAAISAYQRAGFRDCASWTLALR
jgi:ribosomal protein S18 acetylase RimI-like enzyme